jgi:hypothetical protein
MIPPRICLFSFGCFLPAFYSQFTANLQPKISQNQPKTAKISQNQPKTAKIGQNQPKSARISQNQPKSAKNSQKQLFWDCFPR